MISAGSGPSAASRARLGSALSRLCRARDTTREGQSHHPFLGPCACLLLLPLMPPSLSIPLPRCAAPTRRSVRAPRAGSSDRTDLDRNVRRRSCSRRQSTACSAWRQKGWIATRSAGKPTARHWARTRRAVSLSPSLAGSTRRSNLLATLASWRSTCQG